MLSPCLKCNDRHFLCHNKCIKYLEFKAKVAEVNKIKSSYKVIDYNPNAKAKAKAKRRDSKDD